MAAQANNQTAYMIRPTEWSDTIIRARAHTTAQARTRMHAGLFSLWGAGFILHRSGLSAMKGVGALRRFGVAPSDHLRVTDLITDHRSPITVTTHHPLPTTHEAVA